MNQPHPLRVSVKGLLIFVAINWVFAAVNPSLGALSVYNHLVRGRERLPVDSGTGGYNTYPSDPGAMLASHVIARGPKPEREFRVAVMGDSQVWGWSETVDDDITAQLNNAGLQACEKQLRFYNLGYWGPSVVRDFLLFHDLRAYDPDMVIWMANGLSFTVSDIPSDSLLMYLGTDQPRAAAVLQEYGLDQYRDLLGPEPTLLERSPVAQRRRLARLGQLQLDGFLWAATGIDNDMRQLPFEFDVPADEKYFQYSPPELPDSALTLDVLPAARRMLDGIPVVFVNEPIYRSSGRNSEIRYSSAYPRWAYDQFRQRLPQYAEQPGWTFLDLYDLIPSHQFSDQVGHLRPGGEKQLAKTLIPYVLKIACPQTGLRLETPILGENEISRSALIIPGQQNTSARIKQRGWPYLDLYDFVPPNEYANTILHLSADVEAKLAGALAPEIVDLSCP